MLENWDRVLTLSQKKFREESDKRLAEWGKWASKHTLPKTVTITKIEFPRMYHGHSCVITLKGENEGQVIIPCDILYGLLEKQEEEKGDEQNGEKGSNTSY